MQQEDIAVVHYLDHIHFNVANVAASADGTAVPRNANAAVWVAPVGGSIVGLAATLSAAVTAGTLTVKVTINGTESTVLTLIFDATSNPQYPRAWQDAGVVRFSAGDRIGVAFDSDSGLLPTGSADLGVDVYAVLEHVRF